MKFTTIQGLITFSPKKILLTTTHWEEYFVIPRNLPTNLLTGDLVLARIVTPKSAWKLSEVKVVKLLERTKKILLGTKIHDTIVFENGSWTLKKLPLDSSSKEFDTDLRYECSIAWNKAHIIKKFINTSVYSDEIWSILFMNDISLEWSRSIRKEEERLKNNQENWEAIAQDVREDSILHNLDIESSTIIDANKPLYTLVTSARDTIRVSFKNWYTLTIDWADAKDLDDAISIARYANWDYLLGVHIADVSDYVQEKSILDQEALKRGTSIYLPESVIPMLPETLSNNLCSLNTISPKKTLTCLMRIEEHTGRVIKTDIVESIIQSYKRGVYEDIYSDYKLLEAWADSSEDSSYTSQYETTLKQSFDLHHTLKNRRNREGKIEFETTELYFEIENHIPTSVHKRTRNEAHMLIEECMVLANEEVSKWCYKRKIPHLSRVHEDPAPDAGNIIATIIGKKTPSKKKTRNSKQASNWKNKNSDHTITPLAIRSYLMSLSSELLYQASRLILPKMAKAHYSANKHGHFGLALEYYSHFTSPIRRYPDLVTHRMIKKYLHKKLQFSESKWITKRLSNIAEISSQNERKAENIENIVDKIYTTAYMQSHIGEIFSGKISGVAPWWIFVELSNGIEVTVYLPYKKYQIDEIFGHVIDRHQNIIFSIWQLLDVEIVEIKVEEKRIVASIVKS